ncbi:MAG: helix-turn-helix transcriptional regulator [Erysipelotrichaceae bacterium]|nr:helix-turn-helix transcriptional regulator [Erysipelotrichaceae bacterium]
MDQKKTGKFIAELRKEQNMTQQELADRLNVTDRAVGNWENGRRMPDYSILMELCARLNVSVNELLAGERVQPEEKEKQFEYNIRDIMAVNMKEKKRHQITVAFLSGLLVALCCLSVMFVLIREGVIMDPDLRYVRRFSEESQYFKYEQLENISLDYEMGVNRYGTVVFRYPAKALERLKTDCSEGIEAVRKAFDLPELDSRSFRLYKTYGWQLIDADATAPWGLLEQGRLISRVLDIYENSFYDNFRLRNS